MEFGTALSVINYELEVFLRSCDNIRASFLTAQADIKSYYDKDVIDTRAEAWIFISCVA